MLSEKEIMELGERAMNHISLMEKYGVYVQQCPDQQVRDVLTRQQQLLQNHFQMMMGFIQNTQNLPGGMQNIQNLQGGAQTQAQWRPIS